MARFTESEKVLCFHGPLIYEAKIIKVGADDSARAGKYFVHYHGWNKNWDEWVPEARMLKYTESNLEKKRALIKAHEAAVKAKKAGAGGGGGGGGGSAAAATKKKQQDLLECRVSLEAIKPPKGDKALAPPAPLPPPPAPATAAGGETIAADKPAATPTRSSSRKSATPLSTSAKNNAKRIKVSSRELLHSGPAAAGRAEGASSTDSSQDGNQVPEGGGAAAGPSSSSSASTVAAATADTRPPDNTVETEEQFCTRVEVRIKIPDELKPYLVDDWDYLTRQRKLAVIPARLTAGQIIADYVKQRTSNKSASSAKTNKEGAILEVTEGLKEYFNVMLGSQLLYKFEREQHADILKERPDAAMCDVYGAIHLLRLFVKLPSMLTYTPLGEKSVHLLLHYINDFLCYMKKNASTLFSVQDYGTSTPDYHRRAL